MRKLLVAAMLVCIASPVFAHTPAHPAKKKLKAKVLQLKTEEQKTLYAIGLVMAKQLTSFSLTPAELRLVREGLNDGVLGRAEKVDYATYSKKSQELGIARRDAYGKKLEALAPVFIAHAAAEPDAVTSASGTIYLKIAAGEGASPGVSDQIKIHYRSTLIDGREMDNTHKRGEPEEAKVSEFIKCLSEGVQLMKVGEKGRLVCPPETALGSKGYDHVPPNATLVYDIELVEIVKEKQQ